MNKHLLWLLFPFAGIGLLIYYLYQKSQATAQAATTTAQSTTGTAALGTTTASSNAFPGWAGYTSSALANLGISQTQTQGLLTSISNAFGLNDGGTNPSVSTGGSSTGGVQSSGSGAGTPTPLSQTISDIWDTGFTQNNYSLAPLNNFDVQTAAANAANTSQNQVTTGINDDDSGDDDDE